MATPLPELVQEILNHPDLNLKPASPSGETVPKFLSYLALWQKWNKKINLTSENEPEAFFRRHCFDSLQYARSLEGPHRVMDIGSGGGFPAIPLKICFPELKLVLVESQRKRASFLSSVVRELGLEDTEVQNVRIEELDASYKESFDRVLFRAVSSLEDCLEMGSPFLRPGGRLVVKKPPDETPASGMARHLGMIIIDSILIRGFHGESSHLMIYGRESWA